MTQPCRRPNPKWTGIRLSRAAVEEMKGRMYPGESYEQFMRRMRLLR